MGRYLVLGTLARGGMGEVLRARVIGAAGATKEVCIKRIRATRLEDKRAVERFVHEARLSLSLTHANIVATFDFGRADLDYFLAMEWIDGADLDRIARASTAALPVGAVAHLGCEVARALRYAHEADGARDAIVHCDVKPSNILVSRSGDVKLADFGVAVARLEGHRGGTPRYTAPELRDGGAVTPKADLYSLGVVLKELLALTGPSPAEQPIASVAVEVAALVGQLLASAPQDRPDASAAVSRLEELAARARVAGETSARDELGRRAGLAAPSFVGSARDEMDPDASYLRDGASDIESRMTATLSTAAEPAAASRTSRPILLALTLACVMAVALGFALAPFVGPADPPADTGSVARSTDPPRLSAPEIAPPASLPEPAIIAGAVVPTTSEDPNGSPTITRPAPLRVSSRSRPPREPPPAEVVDEVDERAQSAAPAVLRLNAIPWANVEVDGRALGPTPILALELDAGEHVFVFTNPVLERTRSERVTVVAGERRDVILTM